MDTMKNMNDLLSKVNTCLEKAKKWGIKKHVLFRNCWAVLSYLIELFYFKVHLTHFDH